MHYEAIKDKEADEFKRLTGVHKETFAEMVRVLKEAAKQKLKAGRTSKLSIEDQLLLTLLNMLFALSKSGVFSKRLIATGASGLLYGFRSLPLSSTLSLTFEHFRKRSFEF